MTFAIVRVDEINNEKLAMTLKAQGQVITEVELVQMHSLAQIEVSRGNRDLNLTLWKCTKDFCHDAMTERSDQ